MNSSAVNYSTELHTSVVRETLILILKEFFRALNSWLGNKGQGKNEELSPNPAGKLGYRHSHEGKARSGGGISNCSLCRKTSDLNLRNLTSRQVVRVSAP